MAEFRGEYATDEQGEDLAELGGGLVALFDEHMGAAGLTRVEGAPEPGDVAVVSVLGVEAGAVFVGPRWAFVANRGLAFASLDGDCVLGAWRPRRDG